MPIKIPDTLPAKEILAGENIFVMDERKAYHQDIRPLRIAILNLMPTKETTETQLLRLIGNTSFKWMSRSFTRSRMCPKTRPRSIWTCFTKHLTKSKIPVLMV